MGTVNGNSNGATFNANLASFAPVVQEPDVVEVPAVEPPVEKSE